MTSTAIDEKARNFEMVRKIASDIENGMTYAEAGLDSDDHDAQPDDMISGFDYISDVYDIQYILASDRETVLGARLMVACGGPNIWIDTQSRKVELYWWGDYAECGYSDDPMGIDEAVETLFHC